MASCSKSGGCRPVGTKGVTGVVFGSEDLMKEKSHGSCNNAPIKPLRWNVDYDTADRICCYNRHYAEYSGYFLKVKEFMTIINNNIKEEKANKAVNPITFYDPVSGAVLFRGPINRSYAEFLEESADHGWPSMRDAEVDWSTVRVLSDGEVVSTAGTHLGHNLPDKKGNRYCINLVSISGREPEEKQTGK